MQAQVNHNYTEDELSVLRYFFTDPESSVYAAKDTLGSELWALLAGGASRSHLRLCDRFLQIFRDQAGSDDVYTSIIARMRIAVQSNDMSTIWPALAKATSFMRTWAVNYGHNSLKDSCTDRIAIDRLSIRAAKILEQSSLGAFQEKSTRYVDFSLAVPHIPEIAGQLPELSEFDAEIQDILHQSTGIYEKVLGTATKHYVESLDPADFRTEDAFLRTAKAKAFDTARYCLLANKPTALAFTMPSRETERHFSALLAHPNQEVRVIAAAALQEAKKINPGLLTHVEPNGFQYASPKIAAGIYETLESSDLRPDFPVAAVNHYTHSDEANVTLASPVADTALYVLAATILIANRPEGSPIKSFGATYAELYGACDDKACIDIIEARLNSRGKHDELPKEFSTGEFIFDVVMDYGAFRDLQRHRVGLQVCSDLDCSTGVTIPSLLTLDKFEDLCNEYVDYMQAVADLHARIRSVDPSAAEYFFALGHNVVFTYSCNFRQLFYVTELRSQPQGHESYRVVAQAMCMAVVDELLSHEEQPELHERLLDLFRVDWSSSADRRTQENK